MRNKIRTSKKILAMALAASVLTPAITSPIPTYAKSEVPNVVMLKDIKGHWAESTINSAIKKGYVSGFSNGTFKPNQSVTYAEFIKMLVTALNPNDTFDNLSGSEWYETYVNEAEKIGLIVDGEFTDSQMNTSMTRLALAKLSAKAVGESTSNDKEWFYLATTNGLINGIDSKGTLDIASKMTRAQAVGVIERVLQVNNGVKLAVDTNAVDNAKSLATIGVMDIKGHWAESSIKSAIQKGYVVGYSDGTYKPEKSVTNAEFVKMLAIALEPNASYEVISGGNWHQPYMNSAKATGLIKGTELSAVNNKMIRSDLAKLGAKAIGLDTTDDKQWMYLATSNGLINGVDSKGTLAEKGTMTRAEAATLIERVLQVKNGEKLAVDKYAVSNAEILWHKTNVFTMIPQWFNPNKIDEINMSDKSLTSIAENGNVISKTNKLIAIDLDDPKDPYRYLLNDKKLYEYDSVKDKVNYSDINKTKNGYVFLSLNELTIKNTSTITQTHIDGANILISPQTLNDESLNFMKGIVNKDGSSTLFSIKKGQSKNKYEYSAGAFISKDYKMTDGRGILVYFNGLINWGGNNSGELYSYYNY